MARHLREWAVLHRWVALHPKARPRLKARRPCTCSPTGRWRLDLLNLDSNRPNPYPHNPRWEWVARLWVDPLWVALQWGLRLEEWHRKVARLRGRWEIRWPSRR